MFGGSVCAGADLLPPAGDGWRSLAVVRDGNALPLGKPPARGSQGYPQRLSPLPLTLLRRTASGSEKRSSSMRQPPRRRRHHPPRDGSHRSRRSPKRARRRAQIGAGTDTPTPVARGGPLHRSALKRPFLLDRARPVFFSARRKRKWGVHPRWTSPLREQKLLFYLSSVS